MSEAPVFTTVSPDTDLERSVSASGPKTTPQAVVEFPFDNARFMISPHPDQGSALALRMQGQCMAINVATICFRRGKITHTQWETPFSGRPPAWQEALLTHVVANADPALREVG
ncbi:hypothetical protein [Natronoglycomyces albus]|uniref:Uncharacterized protein n=1 Tax=Natronoglycomyces albus TaxID=2811108 RepID=A0A895XJ23_9ACTN|nr:hypothetical protein [Natronoglycomyces albus]QSB04967.1 hypothetical protein JQS30_14565 [Natronoglycomyces albus]